MKKNKSKGFTIVELVIVIAVIAILAAVLIPTFSGVIDKANASSALQTARSTLTNALNMSTTAQLQGEDDNGYHTYILINGYAYGYEGNELVAIDYPDTGSTSKIKTDAKYDSSKKVVTAGVNTIAIAAENLVAQANNEKNYTKCTDTEVVTTGDSKVDFVVNSYVYETDTLGTWAVATISFDSGKKYYAIPKDWNTTYKNYYEKSNDKFELLDDDSAPVYKPNTYYTKNATATVYDIDNVASVITGATDIESITNVTLVSGVYYVNLTKENSQPSSGNYYSVKSGDATEYYSYDAKLLINSDFSNKVVVLTYFA